jgi:hypothetical protein
LSKSKCRNEIEMCTMGLVQFISEFAAMTMTEIPVKGRDEIFRFSSGRGEDQVIVNVIVGHS